MDAKLFDVRPDFDLNVMQEGQGLTDVILQEARGRRAA
jgi:hypothetical protein